MNWMNKSRNKNIVKSSHKSRIPKGIWTQCKHCLENLYCDELRNNLGVCPQCDYHMAISARDRLNSFLDFGSKHEIGKELDPIKILNYRNNSEYRKQILFTQKKTKEKDALIVMQGKLYNIPVIAAAFEFSFMGGSMGLIVGSRFVLAVKKALKNKCPLIVFLSSGGARIQEELVALMQMAKTSAALLKMYKANFPYISVLTNPTMGGVSASIGMLGDINVAEPKALIGFTGSRVIKNTTKKQLPKNFQRSEFLLSKGMIDMIIHRLNMRIKLAKIISKIMHQPRII